MNRLSPRTLAKRKAQCEAAHARAAELTQSLRQGLPQPPLPDVFVRAEWDQWRIDYRQYVDALPPGKAQLWPRR